MIKKVILFAFIFIFGFSLYLFPPKKFDKPAQIKPEIIGFLPYWLVNNANKDYSKYITTLTYFGLTISPNGSIQKYSRPGETEPGWNKLATTKLDPRMKLSLLVFSGVPSAIDTLISDPASSAATLVLEVAPIMNQYGFTDLNLDVENVLPASESARENFVTFVRDIKMNLPGTLTIDASPTDLIKERLIDLKRVGPYVDRVVLMTYDYHYAGSMVTGPVSPIGGAGIDSEFDVETAVQKALEVLPKEKIILGVPLYGYEWETLDSDPRSAVLPGSGQVASNRRAETLIASYSARLDPVARESYIVYKDEKTGTYHQIFYPDAASVQAKIDLANKYSLGGLAFWALGYDGDTILQPVENYLQK